MNILHRYKNLSEEDKENLTIYNIYSSIYSVFKNNMLEVNDDTVLSIKDLSHKLYLKDEYYNLSEVQIADFLSDCYVLNHTFLKQVENVSYNDILTAIDEKDYNFYKKVDMER